MCAAAIDERYKGSHSTISALSWVTSDHSVVKNGLFDLDAFGTTGGLFCPSWKCTSCLSIYASSRSSSFTPPNIARAVFRCRTPIPIRLKLPSPERPPQLSLRTSLDAEKPKMGMQLDYRYLWQYIGIKCFSIYYSALNTNSSATNLISYATLNAQTGDGMICHTD